jgi:hypothetical protein
MFLPNAALSKTKFLWTIPNKSTSFLIQTFGIAVFKHQHSRHLNYHFPLMVHQRKNGRHPHESYWFSLLTKLNTAASITLYIGYRNYNVSPKWHTTEKKNNLRGFGPLANYAERPPLLGEAVPTFLRIEGVAWSVQRIPPVVFSVFLTRAATISSK